MKNQIHNKIRNFAIIAHIDHGKSTLADRLMEETKTVTARESTDRMMDTLELEQERGITIKLQTARMGYTYAGGKQEFNTDEEYVLNLIDTPGHVDFSYEVSRSLAAADGALLVVDASQGIQAQTLTTVYKAFEYDLEIIPVLNKIDLPNAEVERVTRELEEVFAFDRSEIIKTSAKTGEGIVELLNAIVERVPAAKVDLDNPTRALVYDTFYHEHKGVVALIRMMEGRIEEHQKLFMIGNNTEIEPIEIGYPKPKLVRDDFIHAGEIGYIATGLKDIRAVHVGDTMTTFKEKSMAKPLAGYSPPKPMVFASLYPIDADDFAEFQEALEKLALNDAALTYTKESSQALGSGFLCGYLGLLHMEITQERLEREFNIDLITTSPSVEYKLKLKTKDYSKIPNINTANIDDDEYLHIRTAAEFPDPTLIDSVEEPWVKLDILTPETYIGAIMELAQANRGVYKSMEYVTDQQISGQKHVTLKYEIPTAEIVTNFFDRLKSVSKGYASMDYEFIEYRESDVVKVNIIINYEVVEALSFITHRDNAEFKGRTAAKKLVELIPRQQFKVPIQAAINQKVIARETIQAYRKDVTAKLYGGDITRKKKLLEKQKKGKKKMKMIGKIELPKEVFLKALKTD
ncbi:translation elongation factor 4 [Candidatus Dojkabacteria bacterium]|uniref:Elongation factor 4 n=1 Tax=Candidatus Dojkabacteria bacterium TaxID=2099670 RepID=A0A955L5G5_9BACT|nr:translation elongation factor 4 [Candidatus Dojkabacteria bacterium]